MRIPSCPKLRKRTLVELTLAWCLGLTTLAASSAQRAGTTAAAAVTIPTTTINDTVFRADGTTATGSVLISWPAFSTSAGLAVPAGTRSVTLGAGGALNVQLVPNAGSNPMGSYYTVNYHLDDGSQTREYWVVPVSAQPVKVGAIRSSVLPASVAMQTASTAFVNQAIANAVLHPEDASAYVQKAGDTMTGPLVLYGDPQAPLQAATMNYVDTQTAGLQAGLGQKVSTMPQASQAVAQPLGTQLAVNNLNGALYAAQYPSGAGNNGIANAAASPDCTSGCDIVADRSYASAEQPAAPTLPNATEIDDHRGGQHKQLFKNPLNADNSGNDAGTLLDLQSSQSTQDVHTLTGASNVFNTTLALTNEALTGGNNDFPQLLQGTVPYFKTTYSALSLTGNSYTEGQHVLNPQTQNCYGVGDCLMGSQFMTSSGGFRDDADEGAHPYDLQFIEDQRVFTGTCGSNCTPGSTAVQVNVSGGLGTQGDGRYLVDNNPAHVIANGALVGGTTTGRQPSATFSGTSFALSTLLETAQTVTSQANDVRPGTVIVPIVTAGQPAGFSNNTAALPTAAGIACVADTQPGDGRPLNFETAPYQVVDGSHIRFTFYRPHAGGATIAVGGLCGFGLEQQVDTTGGIRQIFPVIASTSSTSLVYSASGSAAVIGVQGVQSAFSNLAFVISSITRTGNIVTVTTASNFGSDINGLSPTIQGVTDPSYNGTFTVTTTGGNTFTYANAGPNSTSSGGTVTLLTGGYTLSPMAEVRSVFNPVTKAVDGAFTLAPNTVAWAQGDPVEEPHFYQQYITPDQSYFAQYMPRPQLLHAAGLIYGGNNGPGLVGFQINNQTPISNYFGNGGTHSVPSRGMDVEGVWRDALDLEAGENAAIAVHCNQHGCDRWNSGFDLFQMDTSVGVDRQSYSPATSNLSFQLRGTNYNFTPTGFTAGTINVTNLNAGTVKGLFTGTVTASSLPVFAGAGSATSIGAVPNPGANAGNTRFLREDGTWAAPVANPSGSGSSTVTSSTQLLGNLPERSNLLGEHLLNEGAGSIAHDTSGKGNDAPITNAVWDATTDLNFPGTGAYYALPVAENATQTWMFALYSAPFGDAVAPPGYGNPSNFGALPSVLCGSNQTLTCFGSNSFFSPNARAYRMVAFNTDRTESAEALTAGVHVVTIVCGDGASNLTRYFYDGQEVGGYIHQDASTCNHSTGGQYQIGGSAAWPDQGTWFTGKIAGDWEWSSRLSTAEVSVAARQALDFIRGKGFGVVPHPVIRENLLLIAGMDSVTTGRGNPGGGDWLSLTQLSEPFDRLNLAADGESAFDGCAQFDAVYGTRISPFSSQVIVSLLGGASDSGQSARQRANSLRCMVRKAKTAGARVVLATEISNPNQESESKDALNAIIRAEGFLWGADTIADLATSPTLGADGAYQNTNCYPDGLNPGPNCQPLIAALESNAVNELIGSSETSRHTTAAASYSETPGDRFLDLNGTQAQTVALPDCTGYSLRREIVNTTTTPATITGNAQNSTQYTGSTMLNAGSRGLFQPIPGPLNSGGCRWERLD